MGRFLIFFEPLMFAIAIDLVLYMSCAFGLCIAGQALLLARPPGLLWLLVAGQTAKYTLVYLTLICGALCRLVFPGDWYVRCIIYDLEWCAACGLAYGYAFTVCTLWLLSPERDTLQILAIVYFTLDLLVTLLYLGLPSRRRWRQPLQGVAGD